MRYKFPSWRALWSPSSLLWMLRLIAVIALFLVGGKNWLLGSAWHNAGMRGYQNGLNYPQDGEKWKDVVNSLESADMIAGAMWGQASLVQFRYATALKHFAPDEADRVGRQILNTVFKSQPCENTSHSLTRRMLDGAIRFNGFDFGRLSTWMPQSGGGANLSLIYYENEDGKCLARLITAFTPQNGRYALIYQSVPVRANVPYQVLLSVHNQGLVAYVGNRKIWQGGAMLIPSDKAWQHIKYNFVSDVDSDVVHIAITGGDGTLEISNVVLNEIAN